VPALAATLKDPDATPSVRVWAAEALGKIGPPAAEAAVPALVGVLKDPDAAPREWDAAAEALVTNLPRLSMTRHAA